jgi:hypothetical protein
MRRFSRRDFPDTSVEELLIKSIEARKHGMKNNRHMCNAKLLEKEEENRQEQLSWLSSVSRAVLDHKVIAYTQVTSRCSFQRELSGFQTRHRFEDLMVLNQESVTQYESQLNSALGAHICCSQPYKSLSVVSGSHQRWQSGDPTG